MTMGTPLYMSPEQINGETVDHRSDIYSFGVTCYRMLSGRPPFRGETSLTLAMQHLTHKPEPLGGLRDDIPPVLCEIVHKMMARLPADRYQHAREILQDLKQVTRLLKQPEGAAAAGLVQTAARKPPKDWREAFFSWTRARHLAAFACVATLVAGSSAAVGWWMRPASPLNTKVTKQDAIAPLHSAKEQFDHANQLQSDEDAWRAVLDYFPDDRVYAVPAREKLAVLFLKSRRLDDANRLFSELEAMGRENAAANAAGIAGKAIVASLQGNHKESQRLIVYGDLPRKRDLLSDDLWFLLQRAGRENARQIGEEADRQLKGLFEEEQ
jgi:eukaryotic-like serine/threonine-protein kinase